MTPKTEKPSWDFEKFKRYVFLFKKNYIEDNLWGKDPVKCSDEFSEFTKLEPLFRDKDNTQIMIDKVTELEQIVKVLREEVKLATQANDLKREQLIEASTKIKALESEVEFVTDEGIKRGIKISELEAENQKLRECCKEQQQEKVNYKKMWSNERISNQTLAAKLKVAEAGFKHIRNICESGSGTEEEALNWVHNEAVKSLAEMGVE